MIHEYTLKSGRSMDEKQIFMMSKKISGVCIVEMIYLCTWVTLMDL